MPIRGLGIKNTGDAEPAARGGNLLRRRLGFMGCGKDISLGNGWTSPRCLRIFGRVILAEIERGARCGGDAVYGVSLDCNLINIK